MSVGVDWVELQTAMVGGWVTYMTGKIVPAVGDVGVPPFWLDPTVTGARPGRGASAD